MIVETALLFCLVVILINNYIQRKWSVLKKWQIPHDPPSLRDLGHAVIMLGKNVTEYELGCKKRYGNVWGWYMLMQPRIVIHDPEMVRSIMVKDFSSFHKRYEKPSDIGINGLALQEGVLVAEGKKWKRMRSTISPMLAGSKLKGMSTIMTKCINNTMLRIEKMEARTSTVDTKDLFRRLTLDVTCSTIFSIDVNSQDDSQPEPEISKKSKEFFGNSLVKTARSFIATTFPFLGKHMVNHTGYTPYFKKLCKALIQHRVEEPVHFLSRRHDVMEEMINARMSSSEMTENGLTDSEISANSMTLLVAAYDTTSIAMMCLAYNLAIHSNVQEKLQAEIDDAFCDKSEIDFETANTIKYLDMCLKESIRLYVPLPRISRCASRDVTISGLTIHEGTYVNIPVASLSRDPEFWDDPLMFKPERMRGIEDIDGIIYQPFGGGPRSCIGMRFAIMEVKLAFCTILKKYSFKPTSSTPQPPLNFKQFDTVSPIDDIILEMCPRV